MIEPIMQRTFASVERQRSEIERLRHSQPVVVERCGLSLLIEPGVYDTGGDSELLATAVTITSHESFLDVGCGSGIVSLALAKRAARAVGIDISEVAVKNSRRNAERNGIRNVTFLHSDVFSAVQGTFDVIACNPPYGNHPVSDTTQRMFWDPDNKMKKEFFSQVRNYLAPAGRVYVGWADFADIEIDLPLELARSNGLTLTHTYRAPHRKWDYNFWVFEFKPVK